MKLLRIRNKIRRYPRLGVCFVNIFMKWEK